MTVCTCVLLLGIFAYTNSSPLNTEKEDKQDADVALTVVLELKAEENSKNIFIATDNTVDDKTRRADFRAPRVETFTDFIQEVANILNAYEDTVFADFFLILDEEIRKYHYRGCKFYELTENYEFRTLLAEKLDLIKRKSVPVLKADINEVVDMIRDKTYSKNVKEMLDYINYMYRGDAREKFRKVLSDLEAYSNSTSERSKNYLVNIIREGVRAIVFDHYTNLNINVRRELKQEIATFLKKIKGAPSSSTKTNLFPYKPAFRQLENTVNFSGFNVAIKYEKPEPSLKIDPTPTTENNKILILKASDKKHGDEVTKLKTSKEESNSQQMKLTYVSTDESSSDETIEGNSIDQSQEHQEFTSQSYATLFTEEISRKTTGKPEIIYKSELKSKLVQRMLVEESSGRLPTVLPTTTLGQRQKTTSNEDAGTNPVILIKANNSRNVSDEDLRRSIAPPMPEEELSIDVFDREERKRQKSLAKSNRITTVQNGIKDYIKRMRNLQKEVNQLKKIAEYNQNSRINVINNGDKIKKKQKEKIRKKMNKRAKDKKYKDKNKSKESKKIKKIKHVSESQRNEHEARTRTEKSKNKVREHKRNVKKTNLLNKNAEDLEMNKEIVINEDRHAYKFKKQKKVTGSKSTKATKTDKKYKGNTDAVTSVKTRVRRSLKPLPTAKNNPGTRNTTVNDNDKNLTITTSKLTKKDGNAILKVTEKVKQNRINNTATDGYASKNSTTRRYRRVLEFSSPPIYEQPFDDRTVREGLHLANMLD